MDRETFLSRVREAAQRGNAYRVHVGELPIDVSYVGAGADICTHMAREVDEVGGSAVVVDSVEAARAAVAGLLEEYHARKAFCWQHHALERIGLAELLSEKGVERIDHDVLIGVEEPQRRKKMLAADIGITGVDLAIAETGTLLVCARPRQERLASLLPRVHVAVVEESRIVPDLLDAFAKLNERGVESLPSNIALITGPSKTGDIELQLTTGVHGPGKWHVVVVRGV